MVLSPVSGTTGRTSGILSGMSSGLNGSSTSLAEPSPSLALLIGRPSSPRTSVLWFMRRTQTDSLSSLNVVLWAIDILFLILAALALSLSIYSLSALTFSMYSGSDSFSSSVMPSLSSGIGMSSAGA